MIPKIIYAAWCGDKPLPTDDCYIDSWAEKLPGYELRMLGDADIPDAPCAKALLERGKIVNAAQYACWSRLYETGGIYLDHDVDVLRPFDDLLEWDAFLGVEHDGPGSNWAACGVLAATPHHPFVREALAYMEGFDYDHPKVENELGPRMWTKLLQQHGWDRKDADATVAFVRILNSKRFYPYAWQETFDPACITPETYAVHRWAHTWNPAHKEPVSVIIPCYNMAGFVREAVDSALAQTVPAAEIIVVDDGSTEGDLAKTLKRYGDKVRVIRRENGGAAAARNTGIKAAIGDWIVCLDADDRLAPRYIERLVGRNDVVSPLLETFGSGPVIRWPGGSKYPKLADFLKDNQILCGSLFRRKWWERVGGYDEAMRQGFEDWDFWTRVCAAGAEITVLREVLFYYRKHEGDRVDVPGTVQMARAHQDEILAYMHAKWRALGIRVGPDRVAPKSLRYPVRLAVTCTLDGRTYLKGTFVDRATALALKAAGQLSDPRIV